MMLGPQGLFAALFLVLKVDVSNCKAVEGLLFLEMVNHNRTGLSM